VAVGEVGENRAGEVGQRLAVDLGERKMRFAGFGVGFGEMAEKEAGGAAQDAGVVEVGEHPVDPVEFLADVLEEEQGAAEVGLVGRGEGADEEREAAAEERAFRGSRSE
jgi:hypothetical protein